jgi:cytochrome c peroxidase
MRKGLCWLAGAAFATVAGAVFAAPATLIPEGLPASAAAILAQGGNPYPVRLKRPPSAPLSEMAQLGALIFKDPSLSSSGRLACISCHSPQHAYGPPTDLPAVFGGPQLTRQGARAVPSLMYLERQPNFSVGPDNEEDETITLLQMAALGQTASRVQKTAPQETQSAANIVPQGGLFWDGRADTLQQQAIFPLLDPREMDGGNVAEVAAKLKHSAYVGRFAQLFGPSLFDDPGFAVSEALFAVARYEIEDPDFHPYTSKFDYWLEGKARLTPSEMRGYVLFNDPKKANCGGCHVDQPSADGLPPLFTDHQYEALGAPRNPALAVNRDPAYFDLGICGPVRADMAGQTQFCGLFATPTLRNAATRRTFFHNGVFHTLKQVLDFYDFRDVDPAKVYPRSEDGKVDKFNDIPVRYRANVDNVDPPLDRSLGQAPAMTPQDEDDIIAFIGALTDGYKPTAH